MQSSGQRLSAAEMADVAEWFVHALDYPARIAANTSQVPSVPAALAHGLPNANELIAQREGVTYCGLFDIGKPEPPVPLLESHYHRDPIARLRRVVNFYRAYGVVQGAQHAPDHLCVELSYLAFLARTAALYPLREDLVDAVRAFARAHPASFAGKCLAALKKQEDSGPYVALFTALTQFLAAVGGETDIPLAGEEAA